MGFVGLSGPPGGLGQYSVLKPENIHVLPDNIPLDAGAMIEPLGRPMYLFRILILVTIPRFGVTDIVLSLQPSLGTPPGKPM